MPGSPDTAGLLQPTSIGGVLQLRNRICMAAMTRNRCIDGNKPTDIVAQHYGTRAKDGVGMIISEGIFISYDGSDFLHTPLLFLEEHARAWKKVTDEVHKAGGLMLFQPWHAGRLQNEEMSMLKENNYPVLAPSNIPASGDRYRLLEGHPGHSKNITEITNPEEIIDQYRNTASLAQTAGFDGVEVLAQGGYLLHTFLLKRSNQRTDKYGGSAENRCRFVLDVIDAIIEIWGAGKVGIKISPVDEYHDTASPYHEISQTYSYLISQLVARELGFITLSRRGYDTEPRPTGTELPPDYEPLQEFGDMIKFPGSKTSLIVNYEYSVEEAERLIRSDKIDLVQIGRPFISNPDLISRIRKGIPLAENDRGGDLLYGPYQHPDVGYNDWSAAE
ncbi:FMN-linked oxidoreductase [Lophiostoma macrostomum CBS 122681]|uniref:FMN-linked oxidoreductase n=1 Tax=Lophiostoma macrostomum CBS 122681 TaxID=1314788 RepID=A0A6A6T7L7_9PLEO|nr:FMN-linked oxidoreductase [Lophiostoma macrostomum CBS 122681]